MNTRLESNAFFEEMVLVTPSQYDKFKQWKEDKKFSQQGSGFILPSAIDSGRTRYNGMTKITDDVNPEMAKKKEYYLMGTNNVEALTQFNRVVAMQRNLENHLEKNEPLLTGYTIGTLTREIARLKREYKEDFNEMLQGASTKKKTAATDLVDDGADTDTDVDTDDDTDDSSASYISLPSVEEGSSGVKVFPETIISKSSPKQSDTDTDTSDEEIELPSPSIWEHLSGKSKKPKIEDTPQPKTVSPSTKPKRLFTKSSTKESKKTKRTKKKKKKTSQQGSGFDLGLLFKNDKYWQNV